MFDGIIMYLKIRNGMGWRLCIEGLNMFIVHVKGENLLQKFFKAFWSPPFTRAQLSVLKKVDSGQ